MSTACLDPRPAAVVVPAATRFRPRPVEAAPVRADAALPTWTRLAVRAQWGPMPADAVRLDGRGASAATAWSVDAASGSLAAWAAASRSVAPGSRRPGAAWWRRALVAAFASAAAAVGVPWRAWRRERRIAAGIAALRELDDRMLRDLGIERADVERVARTGGDLRR